ncbi:hypothetical protein [Ktedonobacter robiniae]|nr:hypothetical protein [Ktedonobacter robiniae]
MMLVWNSGSGWFLGEDLNSIVVGSPTPIAVSPLSSTVFERNTTQRVFYLATVGGAPHVIELRGTSGSGRTWTDLTTAAIGGALPALTNALSNYAFENTNTQHVFYIGQGSTSLHVIELWWQAGVWHTNDLTMTAS